MHVHSLLYSPCAAAVGSVSIGRSCKEKMGGKCGDRRASRAQKWIERRIRERDARPHKGGLRVCKSGPQRDKGIWAPDGFQAFCVPGGTLQVTTVEMMCRPEHDAVGAAWTGQLVARPGRRLRGAGVRSLLPLCPSCLHFPRTSSWHSALFLSWAEQSGGRREPLPASAGIPALPLTNHTLNPHPPAQA